MQQFKRILIISMNPLSDIYNNGKTLTSFFEGYPRTHIAQLFFSSEQPQMRICNNFYRISDSDMIKSRISKEFQCGRKVLEENEHSAVQNVTNGKQIRKNNLTRLAREIVWNDNWDTKELKEWLDDFQPEIIFMVVGDVVFEYKIGLKLVERYKSKMALYITDDYIMPRRTLSVFWWIRRSYILNYLRKAVKRADIFFTISELMRQEYKRVLKRDSYVAGNMSPSLAEEPTNKNIEDHEISFVYAGGLHLNRYKVLHELACTLKEINMKTEKKCKLLIYSAQKITDRVKKQITIENVSDFMGGVECEQLKHILNRSTILVHLESFDKKNIYDTKLSLSTKIPEYLSVGKPILAIGPAEISSMQYLSDVASCVTNLDQMYSNIYELISNPKLLNNYGLLAREKYLKNHVAEHNREEMWKILGDLT